MGDGVDVEGKSLRQIAINWLVNQGVSTVLLFAIAVGGWYGGTYMIRDGIPNYLDQIQKGYEQIEQRFTTNLDRVLKNSEDERQFHRDMILEVIRKQEATKQASEK